MCGRMAICARRDPVRDIVQAKLPFGGETLGEVLIGHLAKTVPPLEKHAAVWHSAGDRARSWRNCWPKCRRSLRVGGGAGSGSGSAPAWERTTAGLDKRLTLSKLPAGGTVEASDGWSMLALVP